jgi:serine/threonine protein kinase
VGAEPPTLAEAGPVAAGAAAGGMTREHLMEHYATIVRAQAIYYPVAYQFLRELGRGRQGMVFLGVRQGARGCLTRHAIKLFDPSIYPSAEKYWTDMGRIAMQTSRLQTLRSPNLVARDVYEEASGIGYLQMEAVDGVDLHQFLDARVLDVVKARCRREEWARFADVVFRLTDGKVCIQPGVAVYILRMILRGLEVLHEMGFIHSDIKPGNVMIDRLGYVKLVDLGRAVLAGERPAFLVGTPLYMAPETHRREPAGPAADIYSVGLLAVQMLRGAPPFERADLSEEEYLKLKLALPERLPSLLPPYVRRNAELMAVLRRMLEPDPGRRAGDAALVESGAEGLQVVHKQLVKVGQDTEYGRELEVYLGKLLGDADPLSGPVPVRSERAARS